MPRTCCCCHPCTLLIGLFWALLFCLKALVDLIKAGPSKYYHVDKNAPMPKMLTDEKYGEHRIIDLGVIKLHIVISGPEDAPLMLMLHGFPEIWFSWRHQIVEFQKDFRVVALDMRGFGDSDRPSGLSNYKIHLLLEDVRLLIEALGYKSCVLLGHDWGGGVAWAFANKHPDMVDRFVSHNMCPLPVFWKTVNSNFKQFLYSGYVYYFFLPRIAASLMYKNNLNVLHEMFNGEKTGMKSGPTSKEEMDCYKYYYCRPDSMAHGVNYYRANLYPPNHIHPLTYPMPVHIIWGVGDAFLSQKLLEETKKAIPDVTITRIEDCSHWVQNDRPVEVNKAIREFLESSSYR